MINADPGKTPTATKKVPPHRTLGVLPSSSIMYPPMATMVPAAIKGPRAFIRSDRIEVPSTTKKAAMFGGTVKSCVTVWL